METVKLTTYVSYPINDSKRHNKLSTECNCKPESEIIGDVMYICHNSFDRREILEKLNMVTIHKKRWVLEEYIITKVDEQE